MRAVTISRLPVPAETAWALLQRSDTLVYINRGVVTFTEAADFPEYWTSDTTVHTGIKIFGYRSIEHYTITFVSVDAQQREMETQESGDDLEQWDHLMSITPCNDGQSCWYRDEVEVYAGARTWLVWLFAKLVYRYRHVRWKRLLKQQRS